MMSDAIVFILWCSIGTVAFIELVHLYYRIHMLEKHMNQLIDIIKAASKDK